VIPEFTTLDEAVRASFPVESTRVVAIREHRNAAVALFDTRPSAGPYLAPGPTSMKFIMSERVGAGRRGVPAMAEDGTASILIQTLASRRFGETRRGRPTGFVASYMATSSKQMWSTGRTYWPGGMSHHLTLPSPRFA